MAKESVKEKEKVVFTESCSNCRFYEDIGEDYERHLCKRYPPNIWEVNDTHTVSRGYTVVLSNDWCGEWKSP